MKKLLIYVVLGLIASYCQLSATFDSNAGPLYKCLWGLQVKGGVAPTYYSKRDHIELTIPVPTPLVVCGGNPSFSKQFSTPFDVGFEISWNLNTHIQLFTEMAYNRAKGRTFCTIVSEPVPSSLNFVYTKNYQIFSAYLGARYYFSTCCDVAPFIGGKLGYLHQHHGFTDAYAFGVLLPHLNGACSKNGVSGGMQLGLEWWFCKDSSLVLTGEAVFSQGLNRVQTIDVDNAVLTNVVYKSNGVLISNPLTIGIRFIF